jgi:hypothetical protein
MRQKLDLLVCYIQVVPSTLSTIMSTSDLLHVGFILSKRV